MLVTYTKSSLRSTWINVKSYPIKLKFIKAGEQTSRGNFGETNGIIPGTFHHYLNQRNIFSVKLTNPTE